MIKKTLQERTDGLGERIDLLGDEFVELIENQKYDQLKDKLQDIIFRSIIYYNMNQECVKQDLEKSYEKIKNKNK